MAPLVGVAVSAIFELALELQHVCDSSAAKISVFESDGSAEGGSGKVGEVGDWADGVLTVVDAVLSGRDTLSLRSNGKFKVWKK